MLHITQSANLPSQQLRGEGRHLWEISRIYTNSSFVGVPHEVPLPALRPTSRAAYKNQYTCFPGWSRGSGWGLGQKRRYGATRLIYPVSWQITPTICSGV